MKQQKFLRNTTAEVVKINVTTSRGQEIKMDCRPMRPTLLPSGFEVTEEELAKFEGVLTLEIKNGPVV